MNHETRKTQLQNRIGKLRTQLDEIERAEWYARNRKLAGKYFKYRNSYGSGESWWIYGRVVSVSKQGRYTKVFQFQHTAHDIIEVKHERHVWIDPMAGWVEIPKSEYDFAWNEFKLTIHNLSSHATVPSVAKRPRVRRNIATPEVCTDPLGPLKST